MAEKMTMTLLRWQTPEQIRELAKSLWLWIISTRLWQATFGSHPVAYGTGLAAMLALAWAVGSAVAKRSRARTDADPDVIKARRAADYLWNKLQPPEIRIQTRDKKKFKRCDPLPDGMVPADSVRLMARAACYDRYVASLIKTDLARARQDAKKWRRSVRRAIISAYESAMASVPEGGTVWLEYVDKKGRTRDTYRFKYRYDELLSHAGEETMRTLYTLEAQHYRCAECGKDPDDGQSFSLYDDNGTTRALCFDCATKAETGSAVRDAIAKKKAASGTGTE